MGRRNSAPDDVSEMSPTGSDSSAGMNSYSSDRKKQTHLRCERQRREAINSGYTELKELIPQTTTSLGCKTTNAAILFRACDFMSQLANDVENGEKELQQLNAKAAALEMIAAQYEQMSSAVTTSSSIQVRMLQLLLEDCFGTFVDQVDFSTYATITRTLLTWVESLAAHNEPFKRTISNVVTLPYRTT